MSERQTAANDAPRERCSRCRHMPHDSLGWCPNMASDNDCNCPGGPAEMIPTAVIPPGSSAP